MSELGIFYPNVPRLNSVSIETTIANLNSAIVERLGANKWSNLLERYISGTSVIFICGLSIDSQWIDLSCIPFESSVGDYTVLVFSGYIPKEEGNETEDIFVSIVYHIIYNETTHLLSLEFEETNGVSVGETITSIEIANSTELEFDVNEYTYRG